ncbi:hypothetical protein [Desulfosediminicola sp.]
MADFIDSANNVKIATGKKIIWSDGSSLYAGSLSTTCDFNEETVTNII